MPSLKRTVIRPDEGNYFPNDRVLEAFLRRRFPRQKDFNIEVVPAVFVAH